jgi:hypothetical protein
MTIQYRIAKDAAGLTGESNVFSDIIYTAKLGAASEQTVTVPSSAAMGSLPSESKNKFLAEIKFSPTTADVWVAKNQTAAVPAGATFAASTSELVSIFDFSKMVESGDVLHFITSAANTNVSVAFYAINGD